MKPDEWGIQSADFETSHLNDFIERREPNGRLIGEVPVRTDSGTRYFIDVICMNGADKQSIRRGVTPTHGDS